MTRDEEVIKALERKETGQEVLVETVSDPIKHPSHYIRNGLECIDAIKAAVQGLDGFEAYCIGNVIKYSWRWKQKNGIEDLQKAKQYLEFLEEYLEGDKA